MISNIKYLIFKMIKFTWMNKISQNDKVKIQCAMAYEMLILVFLTALCVFVLFLISFNPGSIGILKSSFNLNRKLNEKYRFDLVTNQYWNQLIKIYII